MNEFKITVEPTELPKALNRLADAMETINRLVDAMEKIGRFPAVCNQNGENSRHIENPGTMNVRSAADKGAAITEQESRTPVPAASANKEAAPAVQADPAPTAPPAAEKSYTLNDLSKAGAALIDQGKMPQLLELLKKYGVQAITQLDASMYPALAEDLKALGAKF